MKLVEELSQSASENHTRTTEYGLFTVSAGTPPIVVDLTIDSQHVSMDWDTEAAVFQEALVQEQNYKLLMLHILERN